MVVHRLYERDRETPSRNVHRRAQGRIRVVEMDHIRPDPFDPRRHVSDLARLIDHPQQPARSRS
jgi:hypothetical protein